MGKSVKRSFYTVLPSQLLADIRLTATARIVYALIENLTHKTGECYASNEYIIAQMGAAVSERTLQRAIELLEHCGYLHREIRTAPGQQNERFLSLSNDWKNPELSRGGGDKNDTTVVSKMSPDHNDEKQSNKIISLTRARVNELFEKLWDTYPKQRRGSKQRAFDEFIHAVAMDNIDPDTILGAVPAYLNSAEVQEKHMAQYLSRWLENRGYEATYTPAKPKPAENKSSEPVLPPISVRGLAAWRTYNMSQRVANSEFENVLQNVIQKKQTGSSFPYMAIKNTMAVLRVHTRRAEQIYLLGLGVDMAAIDADFVVAWWRKAYNSIHKGSFTMNEKSQEWNDIVRKFGMNDKYLNYNPSAEFAHMEEFYKKMGWK